MRSRRMLVTVLGLLGVAGCTSARPVSGTRAYSQTWKTTIASLLGNECGACHGTDGGYSVGTYADAIGVGRSRVAVAGDASSLLLVLLDPATARAPHAGYEHVHGALRTWILEDELAYEPSDVHAAGIHDPLSPSFHGQLVIERGYDLNLCASCHGADFAGGTAGASCNSCHVGGPTACTTCHGTPPASGAHVAHARGERLRRPLDCGECHLKPSTWDEPGHIRDSAGMLIPSPRPPTFGALASTSTIHRTAPPSYVEGRCENVYCHGGALIDPRADASSPSWFGGPEAGECGACHGVPPADHPGGRCDGCHGAVVDATSAIISPTLHMDGVVTLGHDGSGSCVSCHPTPGGAHTAHTTASHKLAAPIACSECHVVPAAVDSPGHLSPDGAAEVFPAGGIGPRASAYGATPGFDPIAMTCSDLHCHGGGGALGVDQAIGIVRMPSWTGAASAASCGACHGIPPVDGVHDAKWGLTTCATCHPQTMDDSGQVLVSGGVSAHVNGVVDVR